jgi:protein-S-isoprenylcysteine O-methyltransferase Ste14
MDMHDLFFWSLVLFVVAYIGLVLIGRTWIVWRGTGRFPIILNIQSNYSPILVYVMLGLVKISVISILVYLWSPDFRFLGPFHFWGQTVQWLGIGVAFLGLGWTVVAQHQMGNSWRIGIDADCRTDLVRKGLYRFSRHPIYFGVLLTGFGLVLAMPNWVNVLVLALGKWVLTIETRSEEKYLLQLHGADYRKYMTTTRRWI